MKNRNSLLLKKSTLFNFYLILTLFLVSANLKAQTTYNYSYTFIGTTEAGIIQANLNNGDNVVVTSSEITINTNVNILKSSGGTSTLTFKSNFRVTMNINSSIKSTSGKLNVIFWANATNNAATKGMIRMGDYTTANANCVIETNGGHLWLGGGSNNVTWNGLTVGDGYSWGSATPGNLGWYGIELYGDCRFLTNGGNVAFKGRSTDTAGQGGTYGIYMIRSIVNTGSGNIDINTLTDGSSTTTANTTGIAVIGDGGFTTTTGNINIANTLSVTGNTSGIATGIYLERTTSGMPIITSNQGNVSISNTLTGTSASTKWYYDINDTSVVKEKPNTASSFTESLPSLLANSTSSYSSSTTSVATVNNNGLVTLVGTGSTNITGTYSRSDWNSVNSRWRYAISVLSKADPSLSYNQNAIYKTISDPLFTITATQANQTGTVGTISYSSSNRSVATVNASTGQVTIIGQGSTLIQATSSSSTTYVQGIASYTLYVTSGFVVFTSSSTKSPFKVTLAGNVVSDGGNAVTERGFVYATSSNPTISNTKLIVGSGIGNFTGTTPNLSPNTYYFRAYATNSSGTVYGSEFTQTIVTLSSLGCITIVNSGGAAENSTWSYSNNVISPNSSTAVSINASDVVTKLGLGGLSIVASCVSVESAVQYSTNSNEISFITSSNVDVKANIITNGGRITFWADNDANGAGGIKVDDNVTIDSRTTTDRTNNTHTSGGGKITFAGGLDDGGTASGTNALVSGLVSNDGIPDGYASNSGSTATQAGIVLGTSTVATGHNSNVKIYSGGGDIKLQGLATNNSSSVANGPTGLLFFEGYTINSGTSGNITLLGNSNLTSVAWAIGMDLAGWRSNTYVGNGAVTTTNGNITIIGRASGGTTGNIALAIDGDTNRHVFAATGSGAISLDGLASGAQPLDVRLTNVDLLSASGAITTTARGTSGINIGSYAIGDGLFLGQKAGSLVTSSTSAISLIADNIQLTKPLITNSTGALVFESFLDTFNTTITLSNKTIASTHSSLRIGKSTNVRTILLGKVDVTNSTTTIAGPISIYGSYLELYDNLNTTAGTTNGDILLKTTVRIIASRSITTNGGDVVLWSDINVDGIGSIRLDDNVIINTINGSTSSNLSGGGKIVLAGGLDDGSNGGIANDGIPDGSARSATLNGIKIGSTTATISEFYSGGGDIIIRGLSTNNGTAVNNIGVYQLGKFTANSGTGAITITGQSTNFYGVNFLEPISNVTTGATQLSLISNKASGTAISINGTSSSTHGVVFNYNNPKEILATGGGAINITGSGAGSGNGIFLQNQDILATSGAITLNGGTKGIYTANAGMNLGCKVASTITSSSSDISLISDSFLFANTSNLNTSGKIILESNANSFLTPLTFPINNLLLSTNVSGLRLGKSTNTANVTLASATSIAGPITVYGGKISANNDLSVSTSDPIQLIASKDIEAATGADISTQGGTIILSSNSDGASGGGILMTGSTVKSNGGAITFGGGTDGSNYAEGSADGPLGRRYRGLWLDQTTIDATGSTANGNIVIRGKGWQGANWVSPDFGDYAVGIDIVTSTVIKTGGTGTISIDGIGGKNNRSDTHGVGINLYNGPQIYTASGSLSINGTAGTGTAREYAGILMDGGNAASFYSSSGSISLTGNATSTNQGLKFAGIINLGWNGINTATTGAITLNADALSFSSALNVKTTGLLTVQPVNSSFTSALSWPITNVNIGSTLGGLILGKQSNTATISIAQPQTTAGPITAYGGIINLDANLTTTNNGAISLYSDNPLGLSSARTLTAAGAFKYIPLGTSFTADVTYPMTNLTSTCTGLTIGKTTNTKNITVNQAVTGAAGIELYGNNLNINANLKTTSAGNMYLKGNSTIASSNYIESNGNFTHDGNLVFKSDVNGTAAFGTLGGTFTKVSGTATVERYVPAKRAWRLVTAPLKGATSTTINANWRQGVTGEGLLLFSPSTYLTSTMTGYTTGGGMPNIWNYNNGWQKIDNIDTETMFNTNNTDSKAYLVFATGPQSSTNIVTGATATTLKPKGDLISGSVSLSLTANQFKLIPNPYACPINTVALRASNPGSTIWMVDPTLSTVGGYFAYDGTNWAPTTPAASDAYIQSGQGFFVRNASAATFTISESHKVIGNSNTWFERTTNNQTTENTDKIRVLLNKQDGANWQLADGILSVNAATGNNDLDATDTQKMLNFNENIMFRSGTTNLAIEYSALPQVGQVQPMYLTGTTVQPYQLQVFTEGYSNATVTPFLQDTTTGTFTAIPTDGTIVTVPFTGISSTSTNPDQRFKIVYQNTALNTADFSSSWASVYPNPVTNNLVNIQLKSVSENTEFTLTNLLGQTVCKGKLNAIQNAITLPELQKGMYLITIHQEGKKYTTKLYLQ